MSAVNTPAGFTDYKVADMSLAAWGRRETFIAESEMPAYQGAGKTMLAINNRQAIVVVIRIGWPISFRGMRWRAASACTLLMPGITW